jgi:two-component system, NarL family, nitrate/nitrite response regulator NarL
MSTAGHRVRGPHVQDTPVRIVIVERDPVFRAGLVQALRNCRQIQVIAHRANVTEALVLLRDGWGDFSVLGLEGISIDGACFVKRLAAATPDARVIVVSASEDRQQAEAALQAGARGFVLKRTVRHELIEAVDAVWSGRQYVSPELATPSLATGLPHLRLPSAADDLRHVALTLREAEILSHASRGLTNAEVARELGLSTKTVKNYMSTILSKLQARSRLEAVLKSQGSALLS